MKDIEWRPAPGIPGYIVSSDGQVAKLIKPQPNRKGYFRFQVRQSGNTLKFSTKITWRTLKNKVKNKPRITRN